MLANLYPYIYLGTVAAAVIWYMQQHKQANTKLAKSLFWIGSLLYIPAVISADGDMLYKALIIPRDLGVMALVVIATNALLNKPKILLGLIVATVISVNFFYMDVLRNTFSFNTELAQEGELMFDIKSHRQLDYIKEELAPFDVTISRAFPELEHESYSALDDYYIVDIPDGASNEVDEIKEVLLASNAVDFIDENEVYTLSPEDLQEVDVNKLPNDYGLNDPNVGNMWSFKQMDLAAFYTALRDGNIKAKRKARVFILDTGVDGSHEDIKDNYKSVSSRYDSDKQGHGTHCAGIAAAVSNNSKGIASFSVNNEFVTVTGIKVLSDEGRGSQQSIIKGILKAADAGADVISMSLGGPSFGRSHRAYDEAIAYARKSGAIIVVAAGNSNANASGYIPASCKGVIAVSALDKDLSRASFSNWVSDIDMGVSAPGVEILSTIPGDKYAQMSGTSMATPYVAGLLGIMKAINPNLTTEEAYKILNETGAAVKDHTKTGKFIQPAKVLEAMK